MDKPFFSFFLRGSLGVQGLNGVGGDIFVGSSVMPLSVFEVFVRTALFGLESD